MQYQEISLQTLISYLEGSANESVRKEVEEQRANNPDFAEEFEDWEAFLADAESREAGIEQMKAFQQSWHDVPLDTSVVESEGKVLEFTPPVREEVQSTNKRQLFMRVAIAACILIVLSVVGIRLSQGPSLQNQVETQFSERLEYLLSNKAGASSIEELEALNEEIFGLTQSEKYAEAVRKLDVFLQENQEASKYILIKAMLLSQNNQDQEALDYLQTYRNQGEAKGLDCSILQTSAYLYAKQKDQAAFNQMLNEFKKKKENGYSCADEDKKAFKELEKLGAEL
ncbi:MAG: hypothetical protein AAF696_08980 [Bacteroidota bacterium]